MKILEIRNEHLKVNTTYKCKCPECGTIFLFDSCDITRPIVYDGNVHMKKIECPNDECSTYIRMDDPSIVELETSPAKTERDDLRELIYYLDKFKKNHPDIKVIIDGDKKDLLMSDIHLVYEGISDPETVGQLVIEVE